MVNAKSLAQRARDNSAIKEAAIQRAVAIYLEHASKPKEEQKSYRQCAALASAEFSVPVNHMTVSNRAGGGLSTKQAHEHLKHLNDEKTKEIVEYCIKLAKQGWPLGYPRLRDVLNEAVRAKKGKDYEGVGKHYIHRFVESQPDLKPYWSRTLESQRGRAVNPTTLKAWFDLVRDTLDSLGITDPGLIYGTDESGFNPYVQGRIKVLGPRGARQVYVQNGGPRETITVTVTICADGTTLAPTVIYKGEAHSVSWHENNPLGATIAHSSKGWVDGEINAEWMAHFEKETRAKAAGRPRILLVDGHNSHYTEEFLSIARKHNIHVLCYPAHTTHVFQGLDVVIFGILKKFWNEERARANVAVSKENFISILCRAWTRALTPDNIRAAFRVTGIHPFDPSAIDPKLLAPSLATSTEAPLPVTLPAGLPARSNGRDAAPITASTPFPATDLSSTLEIPSELGTDIVPMTAREAELMAATERWRNIAPRLQQQEREKERNTIVLLADYAERSRDQLAEKSNKGQRKRERLMGDGMPRLLTSDACFSQVQKQRLEKAREDRQKGANERAVNAWRAAVELWEEDEEMRKEANDAIKERYREELAEWEEESRLAKSEKRRARWAKPVQEKSHKGSEKPLKRDFLAAAKAGEYDEHESESEDDEMDVTAW